MIGKFEGTGKFFELHDYSNYRSSDYMSSTVYIYIYIYIFKLGITHFAHGQHICSLQTKAFKT